VLDERKAYRQVGIKPEHRRFSIVAMIDPDTKKLAYFVMVGHSFGLTSAVYNYNRRSAMIDEFLVKLFEIVATCYYDDKFGFELEEQAARTHQIVARVHKLLGADFDEAKLQIGKKIDVLGVTYNLWDMKLEIKKKRKEQILAEIAEIMENKSLERGRAGKLKGVLMFGASQLWGKVGRAFMLALSERQYDKRGRTDLTEPIKASLEGWKHLVVEGPERVIDDGLDDQVDIVIFTDGFWPEDPEREDPRIGAVLFDKTRGVSQCFSLAVPMRLIVEWLPRTTQVVMIEMLAPVVSNFVWKDALIGKRVLLFVDSEAVEGALVKGYSARDDMCWLTSVFWEQALELRALFYIDRVSTDANVADGPSRGRRRETEIAGWESVEASFPPVVEKGLGVFKVRNLENLEGTAGFSSKGKRLYGLTSVEANFSEGAPTP
jgi:hypothetical protein